MKLIEAQPLVRSCLAANSRFAGLTLLVELDQAATPAELDAQSAAFDLALATKGLAIVILSPLATTLDQVKTRGRAGCGAISLDVIVPIAICENPEVNRGDADPDASPPRTPAGLSPLLLLEEAISALATEFHFPAQPFGRPEFADGFWAYYVLAQRQHTIRST